MAVKQKTQNKAGTNVSKLKQEAIILGVVPCSILAAPFRRGSQVHIWANAEIN